MRASTVGLRSPGHAEVCVLGDGAGAQAGHVQAAAEGDVEAGGEGRAGLHCGERALADVVRHREPKDRATLRAEETGPERGLVYIYSIHSSSGSEYLVVGGDLLDLQDGGVHVL